MVIMSTYNGEKFIQEQIDSILNQINCCTKIYVRDDGSTDRTVEILDDYKQQRVKLIIALVKFKARRKAF